MLLSLLIAVIKLPSLNMGFVPFETSLIACGIDLINILAWEFVTRSCLKPQNPRLNHEIHMLFEHVFNLKKPKLGPDLHA